jgi:hypothetical protein
VHRATGADVERGIGEQRKAARQRAVGQARNAAFDARESTALKQQRAAGLSGPVVGQHRSIDDLNKSRSSR